MCVKEPKIEFSKFEALPGKFFGAWISNSGVLWDITMPSEAKNFERKGHFVFQGQNLELVWGGKIVKFF